jgi:uncharacterized membrane protein
VRWILKYFFQGLLVLLPIAATLYVSEWVFSRLDEALFVRLGSALKDVFPGGEDTSEFLVTVLGIVATVFLIVVVGLSTSNFLGKRIVAAVDALFARLPLVKLLHGSIKDLLGAFVGDKRNFDRPVIASLSADGVAKVIGFVTRDDLAFLGVRDHVAVYLPQSYNFAGNLILVPGDRVEPLAAVSSDVMAFLVSGGVSGEPGSPRSRASTRPPR